MAQQSSKSPSTFLLFPWGLLSILLILILNLALSDSWFGSNWSWITLVLIIPAAIFENFKVGYSTMRIMFMKVVYSLISFLDRKSTRLNSSHSQISYAVFCLKKKKDKKTLFIV